MAPGASKLTAFRFSTSFDDKPKGNGLQELRGVFPVEILSVSVCLVKESKGNGSSSFQAYFLLVFNEF